MKKTLITILVALAFGFSANAQVDTIRTDFPDEYLDTVVLHTQSKINNYSMIGVNAGVSFNRMTFNPSHLQESIFTPGYYSVYFVHHEKMFDYLPYFAYKVGLAFGREGYRFKENEDTHTTYLLDGTRQLRMDVVEMPFLAEVHVDTHFLRFMVNAGIYGGYRLNVLREGPGVSVEREHNFDPTDIRWDYGLQGGAGIGYVMSPLEFHLNVSVRYSWSSIFTPDSMPAPLNQYYYRYAYPFDIMVTGGIYFHLSKRYGKTLGQIKKEAHDIVYGNEQQNNSQRR